MAIAHPIVSIGLPVYNGERFLEPALASLVGQDFSDFEIVISDNASTDRTSDICLDYASRDKRIIYHRNEANIGISANHNLAFELSRGTFFKWAAHDDEYAPEFVSRCFDTMRASLPRASVVYTHCNLIDEAGRFLGTESDAVALDSPSATRRLSHYLSHLNRYNVAYGLIRSDLLRRTRRYGLFPFADKVLFSELAMLGTLVEIPEPLFRRRIHPQNSLVAFQTARERRLLFDPSQAGKWIVPPITGRVEFEIACASLSAPASVYERIGCLTIATLQPPLARVRKFVGHYRRQIAKALSR